MRYKLHQTQETNRVRLGNREFTVELDVCRAGETWRYVAFHFFYGGPVALRNPLMKPLLHKGKAFRK